MTKRIDLPTPVVQKTDASRTAEVLAVKRRALLKAYPLGVVQAFSGASEEEIRRFLRGENIDNPYRLQKLVWMTRKARQSGRA